MRRPIHHYRMTDYDRSILPSPLLMMLEESVNGPEDWIPRSGRSLGHPGWGLVYHMVLGRLDPEQPNLLIETGTNLGSTALVVAQAIADSGREGELRTIELDGDIMRQAKQRVELAGLGDYVQFFEGNSLEVLPSVLDPDRKVAVAFLDGNHFHDHVVTEFELVLPYMADDGVIIFDNTYLISEGDEDPRVNGALRRILADHGGNLINLPFCSWYTPGIALWQRQPFADMTPPAPESFVSEKSG